MENFTELRELNKNEVRFFRSSGYLKIQNVIDINLIEDGLHLLRHYFFNKIEPSYKDENGTIVKIFNLYKRDPIFRRIYESEKLIRILNSLLGPNIEFLNNRHNTASVITREVNEKRFHRDVLHWSRPTLSVLVCLQELTITNGCTWVIPCSQYFDFVPSSNSPYHGGTWLDELDEAYGSLEQQALPVPLSQGDVLIFDSLLFHSPSLNLTDTPRFVMTACYHACDELSKSSVSSTERILVSGQRVYCGNELNWSKTRRT